MSAKPKGSSSASHAYGSMRTTTRIKRFVWIFFALTLLVTAVIAYQALVRTSVTFTRSAYPVTSTFAVTLSQTPGEEELQGSFTLETLSHSYTASTSGETRSLPGAARGTMRIINNWSQDQPLQATTRFLTPEGILFRTTERVDVPAGSEATVEVVADQTGATGNIEAGTPFTIPGLWEGLQDDIYGINDTAFTGGIRNVSAVSEADVTRAIAVAEDELEQKVQALYASTSDTSTTYAIQTEIISRQASAQAGEETDELSVTIQARYVLITIPNELLSTRVLEKLNISLTADEELDTTTVLLSEMEVDRINSENGLIIMRITARADAWLKSSASIFQPVSLQNKTQEDLSRMAETETGIASVVASFSPFWISTTPSDPGRIKVIIR